ncbi:hypothetical protein [Photobacterium rosenbergii]|uniref:hypothetical protein n=1 Tax=Photobacterium rosenbergii TaxID=294936 RepID=UPI001C98ED04|nr:hypothetical protein [Photobacterium rosenbergii]MBY5946106.1 hypothetical protein [Photobacterium rosenbergii]
MIHKLFNLISVLIMLFVTLSVFAADTTITVDTNEKRRVVSIGDTLTIDSATFTGNIILDGGSLNIINSATVRGNVVFADAQKIFCHASKIDGKIEGDINTVEISSCTINGKVNIKKSDEVSVDQSTLLSNVDMNNIAFTLISNSNFSKSDLKVKDSAIVVIGGNFISEGNIIIIDSNNNQLVNNTILHGYIKISNATILALLASNNISGSAVFINNSSLFVLQNIIGDSLSAVNNKETQLIANTITNNFKLIPGGVVCVDDSNTYGGKLKGGCGL